MANLTPEELRSKWFKDPGPYEALKSLYDDGIDLFFGLEADTAPTDATSKQIQYYDAAAELVVRLQFLQKEFEKIRSGPGDASDWDRTLVDDDDTWPGPEGDFYTYDFYESEVVPTFVSIVEDIKVIQENLTISAPDAFNVFAPWSDNNPFKFGKSPPEDLPVLIDAVLDAAQDFIQYFPKFSVSLKKDILPLKDTAGLGPGPIFSDTNLESRLNFDTTQLHYIGLLVDSAKSDGERNADYLPVRLKPNTTGQGDELSPLGWDDPNYKILTNENNLVKINNKSSNGIEVPMGLEITVLEIISSKTGVWVGFVSDDPRVYDTTEITLVGPQGGTSLANNWDNLTDGQHRVLYTKAHHIRIKEFAIKSSPDPYISEVAAFGDGDDQQARTIGLKGAEPVSPKDNQNWVTLEPNDVRLSYYSFYQHNLKIFGDLDDIFYNTTSVEQLPTLKYSEGYFYFITGEKPRKTEAEIINETEYDIEESPDDLEKAKNESGAFSIEEAKQEAWSNLLNYLGKNTVGGNSNIYKTLYDKYFVLVDKKVNTKATNPNNQKAIFAIRASYIDSLPGVRRPYINDFEESSPFFDGNNYAVSLPLKEVKSRCDFLVESVLKKIKSSIEGSKSTIENASGLEYDIKVQIDLMKELPDKRFFC